MNTSADAEKILKDYKNFLNIVSHDLKSPVRHLENFIPMLIEAIGGDLNEEAQECVSFINKSLLRLKKMQQALLDLSRVTVNEDQTLAIDSDILIKKSLVDLEELIKKNGADIQYDNLPSITVAPKQFEIVFKNLVENALVYHEPKENIKITISAQENDNEVIFIIQDNGIGIVESHQKNVFDMFRRLHGEEEYGGRVGAGLTITKAIIERHGGKIWAESIKEEQGIAIKFSLPVVSSEII